MTGRCHRPRAIERCAAYLLVAMTWAAAAVGCEGDVGSGAHDAWPALPGDAGAALDGGGGAAAVDAAVDAGSAVDAAAGAAQDAGGVAQDAGGAAQDAAGSIPVDAQPAPAADAARADAAVGAVDAGGWIVVTPAHSSRTILPGCVNGVMSTGILPSCMGNRGVGRGERYAIQLTFLPRYQTTRPSGLFNFDETTRGAYNAAISQIPGSFDVPAGCKDENGFFPNLLYLNQLEIDDVLRRYPSATEAAILANQCKIDPAKIYYLNVEVVSSCRADDPSKPPCWASILQKGDQFQY